MVLRLGFESIGTFSANYAPLRPIGRKRAFGQSVPKMKRASGLSWNAIVLDESGRSEVRAVFESTTADAGKLLHCITRIAPLVLHKVDKLKQ
jgi:hypothetical protein